MKNYCFLFLIFITNLAYSQNNDCGFKNDCQCDTLNTSLKNSVANSDYIVEGRIVGIDTISISTIMEKSAINNLENNQKNASICSKSVLKNERLLRIKMNISEVFKGKSFNKTSFVLTPLNPNSCGYSNFNINQNYIIFGTYNTTADIYFTWSLDDDYFYLKNEYRLWTNQCKATDLSKNIDKVELRQLTN